MHAPGAREKLGERRAQARIALGIGIVEELAGGRAPEHPSVGAAELDIRQKSELRHTSEEKKPACAPHLGRVRHERLWQLKAGFAQDHLGRRRAFRALVWRLA